MKSPIKILLLSGMLVSMTACTAITDITSSTSSTLDAATPDITLNNFIDKRFDAIRKDAAKGGGENIDALAQLMGEKDSQQLARWMQTNYDQLFSDIRQPRQLIVKMENYQPPRA
jgi:hypothetical protein